MPLFPNPDFELYDNTGRTTEQIHAHHTGSPTSDDLRRSDAPDAEPLIDAAGLPPSGQSIVGWTELLREVTTDHQFHSVASLVIDHDDGAVIRLHQFLEAAASWYDRRGDERGRRLCEDLADRFDALAGSMAELSEEEIPTDHPDRTAAPATSHTLPPQPPAPPGTGKPPRR